MSGGNMDEASMQAEEIKGGKKGGEANVDTAPDADSAKPAEAVPAAEVEHGIQHWIVAFMCLLCFVGQFFIWIKEMALKPTVNPSNWSPQTIGAYSFMMLLSALVNYMSLRTAQPWLYVATVAVALSIVLDVNVCVNDWLTDKGVEMRGESKTWAWELRLGYMLSLIGYVGSFIAMPVDFAKIKFDATAIVGLVIGIWLIFSNIAIWSAEGGVKDGSHICPIRDNYKVESTHTTRGEIHDTGLPIHVTRAFTTGLLHLCASLFQWEGGQWMTFIIACISLADYMPAGNGPGRCKFDEVRHEGDTNANRNQHRGCEAGVWLAFVGMWMIIFSHLLLKRGNKKPDLSKLNPTAGSRSLCGLVGVLFTVLGMIFVMNEHHKNNERNRAIRGEGVGTYEDLGAQETYDTFQVMFGSLLIFYAYLSSNNRFGVAGLCLHFGVFNRLLGATEKIDFIGACPWKYGAVAEGIHHSTDNSSGDAFARTGYIMLISGAVICAFCLLNRDGKRNEEYKAIQICAAFVILCTTLLWSAEKWYGQMGYTALFAALFHTFQYKQGLDAVFFWSCLQLASQTPFTSCEVQGAGMTGPMTGATPLDGNHLNFIVSISTLGLFYFAYVHLEVRGDAKGEPEEDEPAQVQEIVGDQAADTGA